tara:strand:- start:118 stop:312 length:195 start_codon:yes stop_codon:yes gene_type:complete
MIVNKDIKLIIIEEESKRLKKEIRELESGLEEAENLLRDIRTTGSHYQIIHKINKFFNEEGEII